MRRPATTLTAALILATTVDCAPRAVEPPRFAIRPATPMLVQRVGAAYRAVGRSARFWPGFARTEVKAMLIYDTLQYTGVGNYLYSLGDVVCRALDLVDPEWKKRAFDRSDLLVDAARAATKS